jgi:hypothetical protein
MASPLPALNCNGCRKCCLGDTIVLGPTDNPALYKTRRREDGAYVLRKKKDGNCLYLGPSGCTIQTTKPKLCRDFDCRVYAQRIAALPSELQRYRVDRPSAKEGAKRLAELGMPVTFAREEA